MGVGGEGRVRASPTPRKSRGLASPPRDLATPRDLEGGGQRLLQAVRDSACLASPVPSVPPSRRNQGTTTHMTKERRVGRCHRCCQQPLPRREGSSLGWARLARGACKRRRRPQQSPCKQSGEGTASELGPRDCGLSPPPPPPPPPPPASACSCRARRRRSRTRRSPPPPPPSLASPPSPSTRAHALSLSRRQGSARSAAALPALYSLHVECLTARTCS